jgi:hypothetical protein
MSTVPKNWLIPTGSSLLSISVAAGFSLASPSAAEEHAPNATQASIPPPISARDTQADTSHPVPTDYTCEFGVNFTIYKMDDDDSHMFVRWQHGIHRLDKVVTTTGARRFENEASGLTWISISSKVILLDSKSHRQLANECKRAEIVEQEPNTDEDIVPLAPTPPSQPE